MTATQVAERHIIQQLIRHGRPARRRSVAERIITGIALAAGMALSMLYLQELMWVMLAGASVLTLGLR